MKKQNHDSCTRKHIKQTRMKDKHLGVLCLVMGLFMGVASLFGYIAEKVFIWADMLYLAVALLGIYVGIKLIKISGKY